jgi:hypothetical protein
MPPNATIDDAIEWLVFLAKVETGLAELDGSQGIPHDQATASFWTVMRILWSPQSLRDLDAIREYIGKDSEHYAGITIARIFSAVEQGSR